MMQPVNLRQLAEHIGARIVGADDVQILGINTLQDAQVGDLAFLANPTYAKYLADTQASAVIVSEEHVELCNTSALVCDNPYLAYAKLSHLFQYAPKANGEIHPTAVIADTAQIGLNVSIGANVVIGQHVHLGDECRVDNGSVIEDGASFGERCHIHSNVTVAHNVIAGDDVVLHSGCVVGADGFGFAPNKGRWQSIAQLGTVRLGNRVSIGANACVDRGALNDTILEDDVIIDNLVQIAHNVHVKRGTAIAALSGVAGSTSIGERCTVGGSSGIAGHIEITDDVHLNGATIVSGHITEPGQYAASLMHMPVRQWRKSIVHIRHMDALVKRIKALEHKLRGSKSE